MVYTLVSYIKTRNSSTPTSLLTLSGYDLNRVEIFSKFEYFCRAMKKLIQRLYRVADSTHYSLLRSELSRVSTRTRRNGGVPDGHLPVYVGDESARFVVSAELLNHPIFMILLNRSAQEYGYEQKGVLRIPCRVIVFERVMELLDSFSDEFMSTCVD